MDLSTPAAFLFPQREAEPGIGRSLFRTGRTALLEIDPRLRAAIAAELYLLLP